MIGLRNEGRFLSSSRNPLGGSQSDPWRGDTQERPCVIIQCDMVNRRSQTVIVAPLLPGHMTWPFVVNIRPSTGNGLDKERHVNVKQSRAVDISRIDKRQGLLEKRYLDPLKEGLRLVFDLER